MLLDAERYIIQQELASTFLNLVQDALRSAVEDLSVSSSSESSPAHQGLVAALVVVVFSQLLLDTHRQVLQQVSSPLELVLLRPRGLLWLQVSPNAQGHIVQQVLFTLVLQVFPDALGDIVQPLSGRVALQNLLLQLPLERIQDVVGKLGGVATAILRGVHPSS